MKVLGSYRILLSARIAIDLTGNLAKKNWQTLETSKEEADKKVLKQILVATK
jgi:hypothetical protein